MKRRVRRLCGILGQFSLMYPIGKPRTQLVRGGYEWLNGRPGRAKRAWLRGLAAAEPYRMPYEQGQALLELGGLARARELFVAIGARHHLARLPSDPLASGNEVGEDRQ